MEKHLKRLGLIYVIFGWFGIVMAAITLLLSIRDVWHMGWGYGSEGFGMLFFWMVLLMLYLVALSVFYIRFGKALQEERKWATRVVGFIVALLMILSFPIGTPIGAYTFWVLMKVDQREGKRMRD